MQKALTVWWRGWNLVLMGGISFACVSKEVSRAELGREGVWAPGWEPWLCPHHSISFRFLLVMHF